MKAAHLKGRACRLTTVRCANYSSYCNDHCMVHNHTVVTVIIAEFFSSPCVWEVNTCMRKPQNTFPLLLSTDARPR